MNEQEPIAPRQATRLVTAARRRRMAEERARILGRKGAPPSALEEEAPQWEKEREASAKGAQVETLGRRGSENPAFSLMPVRLEVNDMPADDDVGWQLYTPRTQTSTTAKRTRLGGIPVGSFAFQLIQRERASAGSWADPRAHALEEAATRWAEKRAPGDPRR